MARVTSQHTKHRMFEGFRSLWTILCKCMRWRAVANDSTYLRSREISSARLEISPPSKVALVINGITIPLTRAFWTSTHASTTSTMLYLLPLLEQSKHNMNPHHWSYMHLYYLHTLASAGISTQFERSSTPPLWTPWPRRTFGLEKPRGDVRTAVVIAGWLLLPWRVQKCL